MTKIGIDTRELSHPKPLEMSIKILRTLDDESYLYMLHRKNPIPLLDLAQEHGFLSLSKEDEHGDWHIIICSNKDIDLNGLLNA
jgi:hypothetical protein